MPRDLGPPHLGLLAALLLAHGAGHQHLRLHSLPGLEVRGHDVRQTVYEGRVTVGRGTPGDPLRPDLLADVLGVLNVQLVKGLDVVIDEGNRDQHQVLLTSLTQHLDGVLGAWL